MIAYTDDVTLIANSKMTETASFTLQSLLNIVCLRSADNCLHLNPIKCLSVIIAPSKWKAAAASITPTCKLLVNGSAISTVSSIKILGVIFTSELGWQKQALAVCSKVARKLLVLQRFGGMLNTWTQALFYKMCVKPHNDCCLPV